MKRITSAEFKKHAGTSVDVQSKSELFRSLSEDCTILIGGYPPRKITSRNGECYLCHSPILQDIRDDIKLRGKKIIEICPLCWDEMEIYYKEEEK